MLESAFARIERDLRLLTIKLPPLTILHRMASAEVGTSLPALAGSALDLPEGTEASLAAGVLSRIQDNVIDELGRPWPELTIENRYAGVLEPSAAGVGIWTAAVDDERHG